MKIKDILSNNSTIQIKDIDYERAEYYNQTKTIGTQTVNNNSSCLWDF